MKYQNEPDDAMALAQRWLPRLLGILPLLIMALGLLAQGGPLAGLPMVLLLLVLCVGLVIFYISISNSRLEKNNQVNTPRTLQRQQRPSPSPAESNLGANTSSPQPPPHDWPQRLARLLLDPLRWLYEGLTASPYPFEAFNITYSNCAIDGGEYSFDIIKDLVRNNNGIPRKDEFNKEYRLAVMAINEAEIPLKTDEGWKIDVTGGCVRQGAIPEDSSNSQPMVFVPDAGFTGESLFSFVVQRELRREFIREPDASRDSAKAFKEMDSGHVKIKISGVAEQAAVFQPPFFGYRFFQASIKWIQIFKRTIALLLRVRVQTAIVLTTLVLFQTSQVKDVLLAMVLEPAVLSKHFLMATLVGTFLSFLLWLTSRQLIRVYPLIERRREGKSTLSLRRQGIFSHEIELLLFWSAWISLALFSTPIAKEAFAFPGQHWELYLFKPYLLFFAGSILIWCWRLWDRPVSTLTPEFKRTFFILFGLGLTTPFLFGLISSAQFIPNILGSIAILFWGMTLFLIIAITIFQFSVFSGFPLLTLLVLLCFFNAATRINDNHEIRLNPQLANAASGPDYSSPVMANPAIVNRHLPSLEKTLAGWLLQRKDQISQYTPEKPYPVYVVTAQGGGIYAAYHSAKALAVLSEQVSSFSDHLFAISGVSGGSFGATIYANALRSQPTEDGSQPTLSERVDHYFDHEADRLAVILSSMLFGDATQTLVPTPVAAWDRSLGLELAFENRRAPDADHPIRLDASFYLTQDPELNPDYTLPPPSRTTSGHAAPFLVLNATEVNNGRRHLLSPFRIPEQIIATVPASKADGNGQADIKLSDADFHEPWLQRPSQMKPLDIRFSTAAGLSARFPVISPYGFFPENRYRRFIDGGLYDNSGAVTAKEVIDGINISLVHFSRGRSLGASEADLKQLGSLAKCVKVYPIAIVDQQAVNLDSSYAEAEALAQRRPFRWLSWAPVDAIFSTREARLQKAVDMLDRDPQLNARGLDGSVFANQPRRVLLRKQFRLAGNPHPVFSIPLGWKLSCQARAFINDQLQPMPSVTEPMTGAPLAPWNADGQVYSLLPCEQRALSAAVKREPVHTRAADRHRLDASGAPGMSQPPSGTSSLSRPFWCLIRQLRQDLALPEKPTSLATTSRGGGTASR